MDELQTDTLCDYGKNPNSGFDSNREETTCAAALLNGCEDEEDLMDHCENESIGGNSDVWKGSDSEDDGFGSKGTEQVDTNKSGDKVEKDKAAETGATGEKEAQSKGDESESVKTTVENPEQRESEKVGEKGEDKTCEDLKLDENLSKDPKEDENLTKDLNQDENPTEPKEDQNPNEPKQGESNQDKHPSTEPNQDQNLPETQNNNQDANLENTLADKDKADSQDPNLENTPLADKDSQDKAEEKDPKTAPETEAEPLIEDLTQDDQVQEKDPLDTTSQMDFDADDDDFNPLLFCPEVSMAVDDNPVVTNNTGAYNPSENDNLLPHIPFCSEFVDAVTGVEISFNLTPEEQELKKRLYGSTNPIQLTRLHCTACNTHLGSALDAQNNRFVHPLLKVLICKTCYHFYTSGEFEKDEDGSELYCRWCGQGGQVLCCSKCEYVFCKRCIRTNFGRKKMFEIRDSDNWDCFRCNPSQLITQRVACYEFFDYIQREMSRGAAVKGTDFWSTDRSRCCGGKKRQSEDEEGKKVKKRKVQVDPDYDPLQAKHESVATTNFNVAKGILTPKPIQIMPKPKNKDNDIEFVRQIPAAQVTLNTVPRTTYRTFLPTIIRPMQPPTLVRISQPAPPLVPTGRILNTTLQKDNSLMKHEWFEKTVRAAARVNSHLSYTLTQLNKAQTQAASVEELAVVHNKLQEILSSSINSLIQIRKNLRSEFIAGIKTVRLPSKKPEVSNDDDVIFVSAPSTSMPMPSTSRQKKSKPESFVTTQPAKGYLKVKSFKELQNVTSECITIPDDTPPPPPVCNGVSETPVEAPATETEKSVATTETEKSVSEVPKEKISESPKKDKGGSSNLIRTLKGKSAGDVQQMMNVTVCLVREDLAELQKKWNSKKSE